MPVEDNEQVILQPKPPIVVVDNVNSHLSGMITGSTNSVLYVNYQQQITSALTQAQCSIFTYQLTSVMKKYN